MQTKYLLVNLINYDGSDVCISGNPQVTHFCKDLKYLDFKRHTNFQYGMVNLEEMNGVYETTLDTINYVAIITDNINNIMCINFILPFTNDVVSVSINRLKIIDVTMRKTIFKIGDKYMIKIPLANIFNYTNIYNTVCTEYINVCQQKISIIVIRSSHASEPIEVKLFGCILDYEERGKFVQNIYTNNYSKIINLPIEYTSNVEQTLSSYDLKNYLFAKMQTIVIKIQSIDLIDNIIFNMNNKSIKFNRNMLQMYNDTYDKIIFNVDGYCLLKMPYLISTDKPISSFTIDVNTLTKCNQIFIYMLTDIELKVTDFKPLIVFNNEFHTYIQHHIVNTNLQENSGQCDIELDIDQMHLKEIIISCTKNNTCIKPIKQFDFNFHDSHAIYTETDCELYQKIHHDNINDNVYTIGFALDPNHHYSTGCVNTKKIKFSCDVKETNFKMDIYLVGIKS